VVGSVDGRARFERFQLSGNYDLGARNFLQYATEDVLIQSANAQGSTVLGRHLGVGIEGRARDRRGGQRDYSDLAAMAYLEFVPDEKVDIRVHAGAHRFVYWPVFQYSFGATEAGGVARYRFDRRHSAFAFGDLGLRRYNDLARSRFVIEPTAGRDRADTFLMAGAGYSYRGPFALTVSYSLADQSSNSFGESSVRHRLAATGGFRLPWKLTLLCQVALQLTRFPDGVFLSPEVILAEDDENHNSVSMELVLPLTEKIDVEIRYALFQNFLPENDLSYFRQITWAGLSWRL
jgi:hypothetical protein